MARVAGITSTTDMETLKKEIKALQKQLAKKEAEYQALADHQAATVGVMYSGVNIKARKGSWLITRADGLAVTMSNSRNAHNERHIYWYDGKKGAMALEATRMGHKKVALWLKEYQA